MKETIKEICNPQYVCSRYFNFFFFFFYFNLIYFNFIFMILIHNKKKYICSNVVSSHHYQIWTCHMICEPWNSLTKFIQYWKCCTVELYLQSLKVTFTIFASNRLMVSLSLGSWLSLPKRKYPSMLVWQDDSLTPKS
jgi:hypothetical protein